jgi:hypothetical protein
MSTSDRIELSVDLLLEYNNIEKLNFFLFHYQLLFLYFTKKNIIMRNLKSSYQVNFINLQRTKLIKQIKKTQKIIDQIKNIKIAMNN